MTRAATRLGRWLSRGCLIACAAWGLGTALWHMRPLSAEEAQMLGDWRMTPFTSEESNDVRFTADRRYVASDPTQTEWPTWRGSWTVSGNRLMLRPDLPPNSGLQEKLGAVWDRLVHDRRADWFDIRLPEDGDKDRRLLFVDLKFRCDFHLYGERLGTSPPPSANVASPK